MYALVGYDKDYDVYETLETHEDLEYLKLKGQDVAKIQRATDRFRRICSDGTSEPFDWFLICDEEDADYPYPNRHYWASYED